MFALFPGFENLSLHVEVEYQGRKRLVVAHMAQMPDAPELGTLVCSFADSPPNCEWLLERTLATIYSIGNPNKYLDSRSESPAFHPHRVQKLLENIRKPFRGWSQPTSIHAVELSNLPDAPRVAVLSKYGARWSSSLSKRGRSVPFTTPEFSLDVSRENIEHWLQQQWSQEDSDARFAWEWSDWTDGDVVTLINSFKRDAVELKQVMKWILLSSSISKEEKLDLRWMLHWHTPAGGRLYRDYHTIHEQSSHFAKWQKWLWNHFFRNQHSEASSAGICRRDGRTDEIIVQVEINEAPSAHERLEARLQLRDWLQGKATPDEIKRLLHE